MAAEKWKRSGFVPYPSVWAHCEGRRPLTNGKVPKFRIQDVPEEIFEDVLNHMITHFLRDEPYTSVIKLPSDPEAVAEIKEIWRETLNERCVLVALLDNPEDFEGENVPQIAGVNMTLPLTKGGKEPEVTNPKVNSVLAFVTEASHIVNVYEKYDVLVQLYALGLSVDPAYRGQGLGEEIVKARFPLGRAVGIPLTTTVFTGIASQTIGKKCGMELLGELYPENYIEDGIEVFKGVKSKCIQLMAARIQ